MSQKRFSLQIDAAFKTMSSLKNQIILSMDIVHSLLRDGKKRFVFILVDSVQSAGGAFVVGKIIRYVASWMTDFGPSSSFFLISCVGLTVMAPVESALWDSPQKR